MKTAGQSPKSNRYGEFQGSDLPGFGRMRGGERVLGNRVVNTDHIREF
jgi:hypothetical protein